MPLFFVVLHKVDIAFLFDDQQLLVCFDLPHIVLSMYLLPVFLTEGFNTASLIIYWTNIVLVL